MFQTLKNAWKIPELKNKILFTLMIVILYRLGSNLPMPWVNPEVFESYFNASGNALTWLNMLSGGALAQATLFALSVSPYIPASIVMQLLTIAIPALERISKDGAEGKKKLTALTRLVTVALALITAIGYALFLKNGINGQSMLVSGTNAFHLIVIIACYCAGAALVIAGLAADGITRVENIHYVERGYENIIEKLPAVCERLGVSSISELTGLAHR